MKVFIKDYFWFWRNSFAYMRGYSKWYIFFGCIIKAIPFCLSCRHDRDNYNIDFNFEKRWDND